MATVAQLLPKTDFGHAPRTIEVSKPSNKSNVLKFVPKEEDMMPGQWAEQGNPTPYELRVTLHTCQRLLDLNMQALESIDCDTEQTWENIKTLEKLHIILMDYLVE